MKSNLKLFFILILVTVGTGVLWYLDDNPGNIAENEGHHPDIRFGWGYAGIKIFTHAINGLHESDFVLAAKIDKLF